MDSLQIENLRQEYDYDSQIVKPGSSYFDLLREALRNFIDSIFGSDTYAENQQLIWSLIAIAIVIANAEGGGAVVTICIPEKE